MMPCIQPRKPGISLSSHKSMRILRSDLLVSKAASLSRDGRQVGWVPKSARSCCMLEREMAPWLQRARHTPGLTPPTPCTCTPTQLRAYGLHPSPPHGLFHSTTTGSGAVLCPSRQSPKLLAPFRIWQHDRPIGHAFQNPRAPSPPCRPQARAGRKYQMRACQVMSCQVSSDLDISCQEQTGKQRHLSRLSR
jgi:hypothetical protein